MVRRSDATPPTDGPRDGSSREAFPRGGPIQRAATGGHTLRLVHPDTAGDGLRPLMSLREALESDGVPSPLDTRRRNGLRRPADPASQSRRAVTQSNVESAYEATLDPNDPRWLVAVETAGQLSGSLLTFERRRRILALAQRVGVRPFDANLIIAAVQDRARRGEPVAAAMSTIALTAPAKRRSHLLSREALPYTATAVVAILLHVVGAWAVMRYWLR